MAESVKKSTSLILILTQYRKIVPWAGPWKHGYDATVVLKQCIQNPLVSEYASIASLLMILQTKIMDHTKSKIDGCPTHYRVDTSQYLGG